MSYDYLDKDVFMNIELFYVCCGYKVYLNQFQPDADLCVVLRGDPGMDGRNYGGTVHVFDYVKELTIDWKDRFPQASQIYVISLAQPAPCNGVKHVRGYLPVIPELWVLPPRKKRFRPLHLSFYKPMGGDQYQDEIIALIRAGAIQVFGGRWDAIGIDTKPLSYWQANRKIASSFGCYGLMYAYQRGKTLSGRMWQAPLNGCYVISEQGTNIDACPGVIEVNSFLDPMQLPSQPVQAASALREEAYHFWTDKTLKLAAALEMKPAFNFNAQVLWARKLKLYGWHLEFLWNRLWSSMSSQLTIIWKPIRRWLVRLARRLLHQ